MSFSDLFSKQSNQYAAYRPHYPVEFYQSLLPLVTHLGQAWDCGTGNGQVATQLARHFKLVHATDISSNQLSFAPSLPNVHYHVASAESPPFPDNSFDLITVGQALHWFDHDLFWKEVLRVGKPTCTVAVWGYGLVYINPKIDLIVDHFYKNITHDYWAPERRYLDEEYRTIPFPFRELPFPSFDIAVEWNLAHFVGYLSSWSAVQKYKDLTGEDPLDLIASSLLEAWGAPDTVYSLRFPLYIKVGRFS